MTAQLQVQGLVKHFGAVQAVRGIDLSVNAGECVALIGPNGAGKSTAFACIAGQHAVSHGTMRWAGQSLNGLSPVQRLRAGLARTFQVAQCFEALSTRENLQLVLQQPQGLSLRDRLRERHVGQANALLDSVGLRDWADTAALKLPYGAKKRLELALALASKPGLLLLDEPAAGLALSERADLMRLVQSLARQGMAVLYTEHNMDAVFSVADRVLVLIEGHIAAQGTAAEVAANALVRQRYLGQMVVQTSSAGAAHA